jgi:hypothetical protein
MFGSPHNLATLRRAASLGGEGRVLRGPRAAVSAMAGGGGGEMAVGRLQLGEVRDGTWWWGISECFVGRAGRVCRWTTMSLALQHDGWATQA